MAWKLLWVLWQLQALPPLTIWRNIEMIIIMIILCTYYSSIFSNLKKESCLWRFLGNYVHFSILLEMEMISLVSSKMTFSEYLWRLNFPLWILWPTITKQSEKSDLFWDNTPTRGAKFKHHRYSENVNFEETSNFVSILEWNYLSFEF